VIVAQDHGLVRFDLLHDTREPLPAGPNGARRVDAAVALAGTPNVVLVSVADGLGPTRVVAEVRELPGQAVRALMVEGARGHRAKPTRNGRHLTLVRCVATLHSDG